MVVTERDELRKKVAEAVETELALYDEGDTVDYGAIADRILALLPPPPTVLVGAHTLDRLRAGEMVELECGVALGAASDLPQQPKLEWRETGLSGGFEELRLNHLVVGFVFEKADGYGFIGSAGARTEFSRSFRARAEARSAVERAVKEALGWPK